MTQNPHAPTTSPTTSQTTSQTTSIGATVLGYPRIGRDRELKRALERYWSGDVGADDLLETAREVRSDAIRTMRDAGLDTVPVGHFALYDHLLDAAVTVGAVPERFGRAPSGGPDVGGCTLDTYFAMARGSADQPPLEMTKWFDTNYHVLVPEIGPDTSFRVHPERLVAAHAEAVDLGVRPRPVMVGPYTLLAYAKRAAGAPEDFDPMTRLDDLVETYVALFEALAQRGAEWLQVDEPAAAASLDAAATAALSRAYRRLASVAERPRLLVASYFAHPAEALPVWLDAGVDAVAVDLTATDVGALAGVKGLDRAVLVAGAVDGRNVWRTDLRRVISRMTPLLGLAREVAVSSSCSLLHVPHDADRETDLHPAVQGTLAFADQKLREVARIHQAMNEDLESVHDALVESDLVSVARASSPAARDGRVRARLDACRDVHRHRVPIGERRDAQRERLGLPLLPTTTIGSFPQTHRIRTARAARRNDRMSEQEYVGVMRQEIADVVALQEKLGLDVLVHGEPERNDMVQYFAEQLEGFTTTRHGWVQSYGSRCVRPPILFGDVSRPETMTVDWATHAQALSSRPVKGMLTGPVTMLAWSFVRDDQPLGSTADQVALALRDEVHDLEAAGITIVQVDEPGLRELLPLRESDRATYVEWAVGAFRLATSGVSPSTQVHTHMCYADFGDVKDAIAGLDADVVSLEAARSDMSEIAELASASVTADLGPGVYDIHSPRVPGVDELSALLRRALQVLPEDRLWVNPDCGLKTRRTDEVTEALGNLVEAARQVRRELATS